MKHKLHTNRYYVSKLMIYDRDSHPHNINNI